MDDETQRRLDAVRRSRSELENSVIDELFAGHISRREFIRAGSVVGMSLPLLSFIAACGAGGAPTATQPNQATGAVKKGGSIAAAALRPKPPLDPLKVGDEGGLLVLNQVGEFLAWSGEDLKLQP